MMKGNRTHVHAVYEKIQLLHHFRFGAGRIILINVNFVYTTDKLCRNLV